MIRILIFILAGMIVPVTTFAEPIPFSTPGAPPSGPRIKLSTVTDRDSVYPGDRFKLYLSVQIEEGWHIYSLQPLNGNELLATQIILKDNIFESQKRWQESPTHLIQDDAQAKLVKGHVSTAEFHNSFRVPKNFKSGNHSIKGELLYRACDNNLCTLPQSLPFSSRIHVGAN
jgi:DsbC/DsbD-like thiol-disulfide interchange protein